MTTKATYRARWRASRPKSAETTRRWSEAIATRLLAAPLFRDARQVAIFFPRASEPDLRSLWEARPQHCFFPRVDPKTLAMTFYRVAALTDLAPGFGKIPEPAADAGRAAGRWKENDLVLVPGAAFDRRGGRIGSGLGCYDRFLDGLPALKLGVGFAAQVVTETLAQDPTDARMDGLCTESGLDLFQR